MNTQFVILCKGVTSYLNRNDADKSASIQPMDKPFPCVKTMYFFIILLMKWLNNECTRPVCVKFSPIVKIARVKGRGSRTLFCLSPGR